jgi:membrane protein required for colicin V production
VGKSEGSERAMNWLDIVLLLLMLIPTAIGLKIGIIKAAFTIVGGIVGIILAGRLYEPFAGVLGFISNEGAAKVVAFAIIFIGVMVIAAVLAAVLKKLVSAVLLGWVNRLGGAVFGFILGFIFSGALMAMWVKFLGPGDTIQASPLAGFLLDSFPVVLGLLPSDFDSVREFFN